MSDHDTLARLLMAWNQPEAADRAPILDETLSASGFYYADPHLPEPAGDRAAFEDYLGRFTTALPDAELETGAVQSHHGHVLMPFRLMRSGQVLGAGHYVATLDGEGRVARLVGFME